MQRDVYAALIKKWHKKKLGINVLQLDGSITHELSFDDCFIGYRRRKLLLMTHNASSPYHRSSMAVGLREEVGEAATQSHYPRDVIISSFEQLLRHHTPNQLYQLLPLLCTNEEAFCALQGICDSPGSFFQLCHRVDPRNLTLRFNSGSPNRDGICSFFEGHFSPQEMTTPTSYRKLPISGIEFNGLMLVKGKFLRNPAPTVAGTDACEPTPRMVSAAAFLTTHQQLTEISIIQRALTCDFFHSSAYNSIASRSDLLAEVQSTVTHMHFMAVKDIPNQVVSASGDARGAFSQRDRLLQMAREKKLFVYERRLDGSYHYAV